MLPKIIIPFPVVWIRLIKTNDLKEKDASTGRRTAARPASTTTAAHRVAATTTAEARPTRATTLATRSAAIKTA